MYEIERKFLIKNDSWIKDVSSVHYIKQGYLMTDELKTLRIRKSNDEYFMTFKMPVSSWGEYTDVEIEKSITKEEFDLLFSKCKYTLFKIRHIVNYDGNTWEIDKFYDKNLPDGGTEMAEIELTSVDEKFSIPNWLGIEVTSDKRYKNINIAKS